uniref:AlNc14C69G4794 protein n=1 Tax=Albugo laibachii Nc14 TaxID=890382 RepID=F0WDS6_9STRA|nr:AlNc14C69G4794 [Albugo laibachii Nc14]|eukprot:CCA19353.1 AlNc14C69G4794 [Albugo laibachii Nc14]
MSVVLPLVEESLSDTSGKQNLSKSGILDHSSEVLNFLTSMNEPTKTVCLRVHSRPRSAVVLTQLPCLLWKEFLQELKTDLVEQIRIITCDSTREYLTATQELSSREQHYVVQSMDKLRMDNNPVYSLQLEFADIFPDAIPEKLPQSSWYSA